MNENNHAAMSLLFVVVLLLISSLFLLKTMALTREDEKGKVETLENETYNTIVMGTGLTDYADIIREYMSKPEYYDQIAWEVNNH